MKQALVGGLVLRTAAGLKDVERATAFNGLIHGLDFAEGRPFLPIIVCLL